MKKLVLAGVLSGFAYWVWKNMQSPRVYLGGKVVLITGASSGIGRAAAKTFAAQGAHVILAARRRDLLESLEQELQSYGVQVLVVETDLLNDDDIDALADVALKAFGRVDVLINNAGLAVGGAFESLDPDEIRRAIRLNVTSLIRLTQLTVPRMIEQGGGVVVNVGSVAGGIFTPGQSAYAATKAAVHGFSVALRRELYGTGVFVSEVKPGWTRTPMIGGIDNGDIDSIMMNNALFPVQSADYVAGQIVNAVRYHKAEVILGGTGMLMGVYAQRFAPFLNDTLFTRILDKERVLDVYRKLGV